MQTVIPYDSMVTNKYRLVLDIPDILKKRILHLQHTIHTTFRGLTLASGTPAIYLASFDHPANGEQALIDQMNTIALGARPFQMHISGMGAFGDAEWSLYLREEKVVSRLVTDLQQLSLPLTHPAFNAHPRITLVRKLYPWQIEKLQLLLQGKKFTARFIASRMLLLKQLPGWSAWQIAMVGRFQNQLIVK